MNKLFIVALVVALAVATMAQEVHDDVEEQSVPRVRRGYGCPFNQYQCHSHCSGIRGYKGGYCKGTFKQTCKCY
uniref:Defensin A n=1 Tax=Ornithodoros papillipes TaxID=570971 RepID=B6UYJ5_9ACAR|nr:defensin A [Ornithodoros papillipes]